jgi:hypothetical protein
MANIEALKKTRDFIKANPDQHDQESWHCGTSACIAGHASLLHGAYLRQGRYDPEMWANGRPVHTSGYAAEVLGLTGRQASYLFYCMDNDVAIQRLDQLIELEEKGETFRPGDHWIYEEDDDLSV